MSVKIRCHQIFFLFPLHRRQAHVLSIFRVDESSRCGSVSLSLQSWSNSSGNGSGVDRLATLSFLQNSKWVFVSDQATVYSDGDCVNILTNAQIQPLVATRTNSHMTGSLILYLNHWATCKRREEEVRQWSIKQRRRRSWRRSWCECQQQFRGDCSPLHLQCLQMYVFIPWEKK